MSHDEKALVTHRGGCHCGAVAFEVDAPADLVVQACNCSICSKTAYLHLVVPRSRFRLLRGEDKLATYTFNTHVAKHLFCTTCGIKSFYVPRSHPDGISVNLNCVELGDAVEVEYGEFDGHNWTLSRATLLTDAYDSSAD